jgi:hypothetical protein
MAVLQVEQRIRNTGRGSDYFGVCECCGDDVAYHPRPRRADKVSSRRRHYVLDEWNQQQYGPSRCVRQRIDSNASPAQSAVAARAAPKDDDGE